MINEGASKNVVTYLKILNRVKIANTFKMLKVRKFFKACCRKKYLNYLHKSLKEYLNNSILLHFAFKEIKFAIFIKFKL